MKLDPKLLARLEAAARELGRDPNEYLAEKLGVCPTCGQTMPRQRKKPERAGETNRAATTRKDAIIEFMRTRGNERGSQTACAKALGLHTQYVWRVWDEYKKANGGVKDDEPGRAEE